MRREGQSIPFSGLLVTAILGGLGVANASERTLDTIVVTATGFEQALKDAPASISVVGREELERNRFSNIAEALADVPGVDVREGTGKTGGLNVSIRGMPSEYTLIMIDGRRQNTSGDVTPNGFGETATSFMPPVSAIERIEVIRGPMSTLYGSDAMGGVINIITRPVTDTWSGSVGVESTFQEDRDASNDSTLNLFATGPLVNDRLGMQVRGRLYDREASERLIEDSVARDPRPTEARIYNVGARLSLTPDARNTLWLDADRSRQVYDNSDSRLGTLDETDRSTGEPAPGVFWGYKDEMRFNRDQIAVGHEGFYDLGTLESSLTYNVTETLGRTLPAGSAPEYGYEATGGEDRVLENRDLTLDSKLVMPLGRHVLTLGGQYVDAELEDGAAGDQTFSQESWALFVENEWWMRDDLALTLGARYQDHEAFSGHLTPRAYLVWNTTDRWTLKGGVSQGYKTPTLNQLHDGVTGFTDQGRAVNIGSPDLEPEETTNYELSALYEDRRLQAGATLFYNEFRDKIADGDPILNCQFTDGDGNQPYAGRDDCLSIGDFTQQESFGQLVNIDEARTRGVELHASYRLSPQWAVSGGYTYTDSEFTSGDQKGQVLTNAPEHVVTARLNWLASERLHLWVDGEYYSSRERYTGARPEEGTQDRAEYDATGNKLKSYELFHLGASYQAADNVRLTGRIYNLLDKDFSSGTRYGHQGETHYAYDYTRTWRATEGGYRDGRSVWLSANYEF
ncbi:outer membrane receptor for ferrienterochelin and colicins [Alkalispirillum mobile]|uniref:Outer membrane receptor for ferrienterochelin and colicins n=1 Tax=Alkalispirillum mobile TaxID=85925 RepID=A0A498BSX5_9GAMM|nr:TonB-dependent receptor [Alkalispirillum mobile]RLK47073.1 outer membrane receptor for ferrienterochelin and colicins [Alkalispirillum mobile]